MLADGIPFGSQYYRAPTPRATEWEADMTAMAEHGFNTVKLWAQWRWNAPQEGVYDFSDLDRLMELAHNNGLRVIINTIFDVAPTWLYDKHPDALMITSDGRRVEPQTVSHRQIGGAPGPCYNHPEALDHRKDFLHALVRRYAKHPALFVWDLWNEPELTCGILRAPRQADMVCYCRHCRDAFIQSLQQRHADLDSLNHRWNRNYSDWRQIELPRNGQAFNDMIDWRMFFGRVLTEELRQRVEVTKSEDATTPVMVHTVPIPYFNMVNACSNDYELAKLCDLFGNSIGSHPFAAAYNTSCAKGKTVINAEIHALGGDTYNRPRIPSFADIKGHVFTPLARGIKGFVYWQYRPETLGRESPAWGLTKLDGSKTEWLDYNITIARTLRHWESVIQPAQPLEAEVAVLNSYRNQVFDWCASGSTDLYCGSVMGTYMALYHANINADIIGLEQLPDGILERYKVLVCPFPYYLDTDTAERLREWTAKGGTLISEAFFGAVCEDDGLHSTKVPGLGFADVFGVQEDFTTTASRFRHAYGEGSVEEFRHQMVSVGITAPVGRLARGNQVEGYFFQERLVPLGAEVLARFSDGSAAVTQHLYGEGRAIMMGTLLGCVYHRQQNRGVRDFLSGLVALAGLEPPVRVVDNALRADLLVGSEGEALLVIDGTQFEGGTVNVELHHPLSRRKQLTNAVTGETYAVGQSGAAQIVQLVLPAGAHELFILEEG